MSRLHFQTYIKFDAVTNIIISNISLLKIPPSLE
jgi:hypothetical protein